jgi:membrane-bound ClpP family serine protease
MSSTHTPDSPHGTTEVRKAGVFDMRNFIAGLIGFYGVVLLIYGIIGSSDTQIAKAKGLNINLWAGIGMIVIATCFVLWARFRPVVVAVQPEDDGQENEGH